MRSIIVALVGLCLAITSCISARGTATQITSEASHRSEREPQVARIQQSTACSRESSTLPDDLEGNVAQGNYAFTHKSDVDKRDQIHHYVSSIHNDNTKNYLPAEWLRSDGTVEIAFDRIAPNGCASSEFETSALWREDSKGFINYGSTKKERKDAALYVRDARTPDGAAPVGRELTSRLTAELEDQDLQRFDLKLELRTQFEGPTATYTVLSRSAADVQFSIPELEAAFKRREGKLQWPMKDGRFVAAYDGVARHQTLTVPAHIVFDQKIVTIVVWVGASSIQAKGQVCLYLPRGVE